MLRYGIPEYRLPKDILDLEVNLILDLGVKLSTNVTLGKDYTVSSLKEDGFEAIFLGLGAWDSSKMRVQGEEAEGVLPGIEFLKNFSLRKKANIHGKVLVVGGGNTAIDCARTALRLGAMEVRLLYRRTRNEMPANEMEIVEAEHEGVEMDFLVAPVRVIQENGRLDRSRVHPHGARRARRQRAAESEAGPGIRVRHRLRLRDRRDRSEHPISEFADGKVPHFLPLGEVLNLTRWQTIQVNEKTFETSVDGVFSGGDVVTGAATAIEAIAVRDARPPTRSTPTSEPARRSPSRSSSSAARTPTTTSRSRTCGMGRATRAARCRPSPPEERKKSFNEVEQGYTAEDVKREAFRCLECGCTALFDCDLRRFATEYQVDIASFIGEAKEYKIDRSHPLIELDPNKCILCGKCVRVCGEIVGVAAYGFINRGFNTVVKPALGGSLMETDCVSCGLCVSACPTGAIAAKIPLAKPGPWKTEPNPTVCHYCGVGCRINYDTFGDSLVKSSPYEQDCPTDGNHCKKGRFGYHYVQSAERLRPGQDPHGARAAGNAPLDETIRYAAMRLKELQRRYSGSEIAVFVSPRLTNEEAYLAQKFARIALKTHNVTSFAHLVNRDLFCPEVVSTASYRDWSDAQAIVVVNSNTDEEHFVVDLLCKKAIRKGGKLIYIGPEENRVSEFAEVQLTCKAGDEGRVLLSLLDEVASLGRLDWGDWPELAARRRGGPPADGGDLCGVKRADLREAAGIVAKSILKVLVFNKDYRGTRTARDERLFAEIARALGCSILALREKSNMQGILDMGVHPAWMPGYVPTGDEAAIEELEKDWCVALRDLEPGSTDIAELLRQKKIKVAVVIGEDPLGNEGYPKRPAGWASRGRFPSGRRSLPDRDGQRGECRPAAQQHGRDARERSRTRSGGCSGSRGPSLRWREWRPGRSSARSPARWGTASR